MRNGQRLIACTPGLEHAAHHGAHVVVGAHSLLLGGTQYLTAADTQDCDVLVPLAECFQFGEELTIAAGTALELSAFAALPPLAPQRDYRVLCAGMEDMAGVPDGWLEFLQSKLIPLLKSKRVLAFCRAGHGRTGTLLASLVALLEPDIDDPIAAARARYCQHAVETLAQAEAIFALRGGQVPDKYICF